MKRINNQSNITSRIVKPLAFLVFMLVTAFSFGQTASTSGDWTTVGTWTGGTPATTGTTGAPVSVTINSGITLTVSTAISGVYAITNNGGTLKLSASASSLSLTTLTAGTGSPALTFTSSGTLYISGTGATAFSPGTFTPGTGTINYNNTSGGQTVVGTTYAALTLSNTSGTQTAGGNIITTGTLQLVNAASGFDLSTNNYNLTVGGTFQIPTSPTFNGRSSTVTLNRAGTQSISNNGMTIYNLKVTNNSTTTLYAITITNNITVDAGSTLILGGSLTNNSVTTTINGTLQLNFSGVLGTNASPVYGASSTLIYNTAGTSISAPGKEWTATTTGTIGTTAGFPNNVTVQSSTTMSTLNLTANRALNGTLKTNQYGTFAPAGNTVFVGGWNNYATANFTTSTSTVVFNGGAAATLTGATTFNNLQTSTTNTALTLSSPITVNATLTIDANTSIADGGNAIGVGGSIAGAGTESGTGGVTMSGASTTVSGSVAFNNLSITANGTVTVGTANISIGGTLSVGSTSTFALSTFVLSSVGSVSNSGTISTSCLTTTSATPIPANINWAASGSGKVQFTVGAQTIPTGTYFNLTSTAGTNTAGGAITVNGTLNVTAGTFSMSTFVLGGTPTISNAGTITTACTSSATPIPAVTYNGTVNYNATSGGQTITATTYNNLTLSNTSGTQTMASGTLTCNGNLICPTAASGTFANNFSNLTSLTIGGSITNPTTPGTGTNTWGSCAVTFNGGVACNLNSAESFYNLQVTNNTTLKATGSLTVSNTLNVAQGSTLILAFGMTNNAASSNSTINGSVQLNGGAINGNSPIYGSTSALIYNTAGTSITAPGNEWTALTSGTIGTTAGYPNNVTIQSSNTTMSTLNLTNNRALNGSLTTTQYGTFAPASKTVFVGGGWTNYASANFTQATSTIIFNGGAAATLTGATTFYNLQTSVNASNASTTLTVNNAITVSNALTVDASTTLALGVALTNSGTTNVNGTLQLNASGSIGTAPVYGSASTLTYNTGGAVTLANEWTSTASGTIGTTAGYPNNLTLSTASTSLTLAANRAINGTMTISANTTLAPSTFTLYVGGGWNNSGTFTFSNSTINFLNGASAANNITGVTTFYGLTLNNSNGATLSSAITVNNALTLTLGKLSLGNNNLTLPTSALPASNSSNYIVTNGTGQLVVSSVPTASTVFPIGTATSYAPLTFSGGTASVTITTSVSGSFTNTPADISSTVNLQWSISASANTRPTVTFQYNSGDAASNYSSSGAILGTYAGTAYVESSLGAVSGSNPYTAAYTFSTNLPTGTASLYGIGNPNSFIASAGVANAPTGVSATAGFQNASVSFTAPAYTGTSTITSYLVTSSPGNLTGTGATSPITVSGLAAGTAYTFTVKAINTSGASAASSPTNSVTPTSSLPNAPTSVSATAGNASATISFTAPVYTGASSITGYTVTSTPGSYTATGASSPLTVTGLQAGTAYTFTVVATNGSGNSTASSATSSVTPTGTYTWTGATNTNYTVSTNWSPNRVLTSTQDVIQFNSNATVTNISDQTVARLVLSNNAQVSLQETSGTSATLTVGNSTVHVNGTDDISIPSGCTLTLAANSAGGTEYLTLSLSSSVTGVTSNISGTLTIAQNTSTTYTNVYNAANGVTTVYSTGVINYAGSLGSSTATSLVFKNGSYIVNQRADATFSGACSTSNTDRVNVNFSGINCGTSSTGQIPISNFPAYVGTLTVNATGATGTMLIRSVSGGSGTTQTVDITNITVSSTNSKSFGFGQNSSGISTVNVGSGGINVSGGTLNLAYNNNQTITVSGDLNLSGGTVIMCGSGNSTSTTASAFTGSLTVNNFTQTVTSTFTLNSDGGNASSSATYHPTSTFTILKDFSVASGCTFQNAQYAPSGNCTIIMYGTVAQSIAANGTFNYQGATTLQINSQGTSGANKIISLSGTMPTIGTLQLTNGILNLGSTSLTTGAISGGSSTAYVNASGSGLLTLNSVPTSSTLFPIGTSSSYAPLTLNGGSANANITVGVKGAFTNTVLQASQVVNLQWSILSSASTTPTVTYQYNTGDRASNITQSTAILGTYTGSAYSESASAVTTVNSSNPFSVSYASALSTGTTPYLYGIGNPLAFANAPASPTSVTASLNSDHVSADISFTTVSGATSYTVTPSPNGSLAVTGTSSPITITGLAGGTSYTFTITANNASGSSTPVTATGTVSTSSASYTWSGGASGDYQVATNWNPTRTTPGVTDILQFTSSATVTNVPTQSIGRLVLSSNATVSLQSVSGAGSQTLTVGNSSVHANGTDDISVPAGCTLIMAGNTTGVKTDYLNLALANVTGVTSSIAGTLTIQPNSSITSSGTSVYALNTAYALNQLVTYNGNVYTVTTAGTTATSTGSEPSVSSGTATSGGVTFTYYGTLFGSNYAVSYSNTYNAAYGVTTVSGTVNYAGSISSITSTSMSFTNTSTFNNQRADATFPSSAVSTTYNRVNVSITGVTNGAGQVPVSYLPSSINTLTINDAGITGSSVLLLRSVSGGGSGTAQTADITNLTVTNGICGFGTNATGISTVTVGSGGINVTGGTLLLAYNNAQTINVSGNVTLSGGTLSLCGNAGSAYSATLNAVNFTQTGTVSVPSTFWLNGYFGSAFSSSYPSATLNLTGNLSVGTNSTFAQSASPTGTLVMKSTNSAQTISNAGSFYNITNLQINNTNSSPNNTVTLNNALSFGALTLTAGILNTTSGVLTVTNTATSDVSGGSSTCYVNGPLSWTLPSSLASGSTYNFPVGASTYLPFSLVNPTTGTGSVVAKVQAYSASSGGSVDASTIYAKSTSEYWLLTTAGNFTNTGVSITRQSTISPYSVVGASASQSGPYSSLAGTAGTYGVTNSTATSTARYFVLAQTFSTPTVTPTIGTYTYNGSAQGPTSATNTGTGSTYTYSYAGTANDGTTYSASSTRPTNAGSYTVTATVAANANYVQASSSATAFTIAKATPTLSVSNSTATYTGSAQSATVTGTGGGTVSNIKYSGSATVPTNAGTYTITADISASSNYNAGTGLSAGSFTITNSTPTPTITISNATITYTGTSVAANVGVTGGTTGSVSNILYNGSSTVPTAAGAYPVTVNFTPTDATNYSSQTAVSAGTFTINKATPTLSVSNSSNNYTGSAQSATVVGTGGGVVSNVQYTLNGVTSSIAPTAAGTYTVTADIAATSNYNGVTGLSAGSFVINASVPSAPASITAAADNAQAVITYTAPADNGGSVVIDYTITAIPSSGSSIVRQNITANPYTFTGLTNGTTYTFTIAARNTAGTGATLTSSAITPSSTTYWNGSTWSAGDPDPTQSAVVSSGTAVLTGITSCAGITVSPGATAVINTPISVTGNITNSGTVSGTGTVTLSGSTPQTVTGTGTLPNLTVANTSSSGVTISGTQNVTGAVTVSSGTLNIPTGSTVILKSTSIDNSAVIGVVCPTCSIAGNITVERFIPAGFRAYRDLVTGVYNPITYAQNPTAMSNGSIFTNWQENGSYTNSGHGMFITGVTNPAGTTYSANAVDATTGLDVSKYSVPSVYMYNNKYDASLTTVSPFVGITNTKTSMLSPFQTYRVLVRGDRTFDLYNTAIQSYGPVLGLRSYNNTSIRSTGSLVTGDVLYNTSGVTNAKVNGGAVVSSVNGTSIGLSTADPSSGDGYAWNMIPNPYICPVLWDNGTAINSNATGTGGIYNNVGTNNVSSTYYYLDPTTGATGKYISCTNAGCSNGTKAWIQSGQAIFIRSTSTNPSVLFKETNKVPTSTKQKVFGVNTINTLPVVLNRKIDATLGFQKVDMATLYFNKNYSNTIASEDGAKIVGAADNVYFTEAATNLGVDGRNTPTATDVIPVELSKVSNADYQLTIDGTAYTSTGFMPILVDNYKKSITAITATTTNAYSFTVDTAVKASYVGRFSIAFKATSLPISNIIASAKQTTNGVVVSWSLVGATATTNYEVEKSTDGASFITLGTTSTTTYTDNSATGTVYYRIKATDVVGSTAYSNVVKVMMNDELRITMFPNPMIGKTLNIAFTNAAKGKYTVTLTNILGQQAHQAVITHNGGTATHSITTGVLAKGVYELKITTMDGKTEINRASIEVE